MSVVALLGDDVASSGGGIVVFLELARQRRGRV